MSMENIYRQYAAEQLGYLILTFEEMQGAPDPRFATEILSRWAAVDKVDLPPATQGDVDFLAHILGVPTEKHYE